MASSKTSKMRNVPHPGPPAALRKLKTPHPAMPDGSGQRPARAISQPSDPADARWYGGSQKSQPA
jgi:hypothetical protein